MLPQADGPSDKQPTAVPVFNLVVLVAPQSSGGYVARIANLEIEPASGSSPREATSRVVNAAKVLVRDLHPRGEPIPWIDPPLASDAGEQKLLVPIHL